MIFVGVPNTGEINSSLVNVLLAWAGKHTIFLHREFDVSAARNSIVRKFLSTDCTHLLFVDSDIIPPINLPDVLLSSDVEIVSGLYHILDNSTGSWEIKPLVHRSEDMLTDNQKKLIEVKSTGLGCCLIKREVLDKVKKPWFKWDWDTDSGKSVKGEDSYFFENARGVGYKIWMSPLAQCDHLKTIPLSNFHLN